MPFPLKNRLENLKVPKDKNSYFSQHQMSKRAEVFPIQISNHSLINRKIMLE